MSGHEHDYVGCICRHCAGGTHPILQIIRHHDGFWEFACEVEDHDDENDFVGLCAKCDAAAMKTYKAGVKLEPGEWAGRVGDGHDWDIYLLPAEGEE